MDEHGWLPSVLGAEGHLRKFAVKKGSHGGLGFKIATLIPHTRPQNWSKSPWKHHSKWLLWSLACPLCVLSQAAATTTSMRQVAQNSIYRTSIEHRHHSIMVHRTNSGLHCGGGASATPLKKASKSWKPGTSMRFHEISRFLKWLTSPNLIQIVSLILGFLATCGSCGVSIWSWTLDKRHIHRCWNSASASLTSDFRLRIFLEFCDDFGFRIWSPNSS